METRMDRTEADWEVFFFEAKASRQMVRVVDRWGVVRQGRLYRCGVDRINVVPLREDGIVGSEVYYHDIRSAEVVGPEPEGLADFPVDWNRKVLSQPYVR